LASLHIAPQGDEEDPDEPEVQIASDPDLDTPSMSKARVKTAFQQQAPLPARQPSQQRLPQIMANNPVLARYEQQAEQVYGFAWKVGVATQQCSGGSTVAGQPVCEYACRTAD
jgi:hypothetical protein